jgi:hypothetical protein
MKANRLTLAAACVLTLGAVFVMLTLPSDVFAAGLSFLPAPHGYTFEASVLATVAIATLRGELADLETRAAAKRAEIKEGLKPDEIRAIEEAHKKLLDDAAAKKREIEAAEVAERETQNRNQAHAWSAEDIGRIEARATAFGLTAADAMAVMRDGTVRTLEAATDALQAKAVAARGQTPRQQPQVRLVNDEGDKLREAVSDALSLRANPQSIAGTDAPTQARLAAARQFRGMSLLEMGRDFLRVSRGVELRGLSRMETATVLLGLRNATDFGIEVRAGVMSTSDFSNILANVASKRLRDAYNAAPQTWKPFCRQSNNPDFKTKSVVQLSSAPVFKRVREGQEFSYGGMTDGAESYALATYGRIIPISRQALINDDLGAFDRLPMMIGRQAATLENSTVYGILTANAAMADGTALFHADHGNLLSGTVIDETNLILAEKAMMEQVSLADQTEDQEKMNLRPAFLVTGSAYKVAAQKILTAVLPNATSGVNVYAGTMQPIADANISGNKWFTIANPGDIDTIEYAYLEGEEGVFIEQRVGFEVDGIEIKGRLDFAAKAIDWRGMVYNPGA